MLTSKEQHQQQQHEEENDPSTRTTSGGKRNQLPFLLLYVHEKKTPVFARQTETDM